MSDPFALLGLEPRFDLDLAAAEVRHRELSRALHPDRHAGSSAGERRQALSKAIEVNDALRVLKDPVRRAEALLQRSGVRLADEGREPPASPDFLMEMLELREELSAARAAADLNAIRDIEKRVEVRESAIERELAITFSALSREPSGSATQAEPIGKRLGELRYYRRLLSEARALEDEIA
ncbi:MAG TPA: Fe-S protein assembly co-chaperone HscB [Polyangiaceae bacterium]|nr:Fe-S protein assembly co-chaperone HscB [Polyangiaceae bacterium]